ncbi:MAG: hypothetical protein V4580_02210 [Bacteroidota bacterium]
METKILLINNNLLENEVIQQALSKALGTFSLLNAENGKGAFNILMGGHQEKPSVILLNHDLIDMSAIDFLKVMQNYYTLNHIKIFLITEPISATMQKSFYKLGITNFIYRPLLNDAALFMNINSHFNVSPAFIGLFSVEQLKAKCIAAFSKGKSILFGHHATVTGIYGIGTKAALLAGTLLLVTGAAHSIKKRNAGKIAAHAVIEKNAPPSLLVQDDDMESANIPEPKSIISNYIPFGQELAEDNLVNLNTTIDTLSVVKISRELRIKIIEEQDSIPQ